MLFLDCIVNISLVVVLCLAFPIRIFADDHLCLGISFLRAVIVNFNRIVSLAVVMYRYLMVCHADFCHNKGEKVIRVELLR